MAWHSFEANMIILWLFLILMAICIILCTVIYVMLFRISRKHLLGLQVSWQLRNLRSKTRPLRTSGSSCRKEKLDGERSNALQHPSAPFSTVSVMKLGGVAGLGSAFIYMGTSIQPVQVYLYTQYSHVQSIWIIDCWVPSVWYDDRYMIYYDIRLLIQDYDVFVMLFGAMNQLIAG